MAKVYVGDVGTELRASIDPPAPDGKWYYADGETERDPIDITSANTLKILVLKPSGAEEEWTATIYSTGAATEPIITYTTVATDFDEAGTYKLQAYVAWTSPASEHLGETVKLKVYDEWK